MTRHVVGLSLFGLIVAASAAPVHAACAPDNGGLTLPSGVCATIFADNLGPTRHIVVGPDGTLYANSWMNPRRRGGPPEGGMLIAMRDGDGDGKAELVRRFGDSSDQNGGTGIAVYDGFIYAESKGGVVRYRLTPGQPVPSSQAEVVVAGLPMTGDHTMHSIAIANDGTLYVNSGSPSNACQVRNRTEHSPGKDPCDELTTRAGIWKFDAKRAGQAFGPTERFATGLRNTVALALDPAGVPYAAVHGRDNLHENWPEHFNVEQGSELPAEVFVRVERGADYGWPYCYYDQRQKKYVLAPEYGGDGKKTDRCDGKPPPVVGFPGHWAPNALLFAAGNNALPERYRSGAFIAFHGSWNRDKQQGYNVVFQPLDRSGKPNGDYEVFADGFAGPNKTPSGARHRPTGLAWGPDGALFVSDDAGGRIWRIAAR